MCLTEVDKLRSPQAWSTGAPPLLLLATMLGLEPVGLWALAHCPTARPA
jgi:glycogen debranching enzyme